MGAPVMTLDQRVRAAQATASRHAAPGESAEALLLGIRKLLEQNYGSLLDEQVWLPFAFNIPAGAQVIVSASVDQDTVFYYQGYAATQVAGVSFIEVIDGVQGAEHFVPPSQANDSAGLPYGQKGKRCYRQIDLVMSNANVGAVTMDGFFKGRFRKGGR